MVLVDENKLLAILLNDFDGKKRKKDLINAAERCKELKSIYGTNGKVAERIGITQEAVREILKLLELPEEVKDLVRARKIAYDAAWRMTTINGDKKQKETAKAIIGLDAHTARQIVSYIRDNPNENPQIYAQRFVTSKGEIKKLKLVVVQLSQENHDKLEDVAKKRKIKVSDLAEDVLTRWINRDDKL